MREYLTQCKCGWIGWLEINAPCPSCEIPRTDLRAKQGEAANLHKLPDKQLDTGSSSSPCKDLRKACESALIWFKNFGFNKYGLLCKDDIQDPEDIINELEKALKEGK